jgi:hypothetical protein
VRVRVLEFTISLTSRLVQTLSFVWPSPQRPKARARDIKEAEYKTSISFLALTLSWSFSCDRFTHCLKRCRVLIISTVSCFVVLISAHQTM